MDTEPLADLKAWLETLRTRQGRICTDLQKTVARAWCLAMTTTSLRRSMSAAVVCTQRRLWIDSQYDSAIVVFIALHSKVSMPYIRPDRYVSFYR